MINVKLYSGDDNTRFNYTLAYYTPIEVLKFVLWVLFLSKQILYISEKIPKIL